MSIINTSFFNLKPVTVRANQLTKEGTLQLSCVGSLCDTEGVTLLTSVTCTPHEAIHVVKKEVHPLADCKAVGFKGVGYRYDIHGMKCGMDSLGNQQKSKIVKNSCSLTYSIIRDENVILDRVKTVTIPSSFPSITSSSPACSTTQGYLIGFMTVLLLLNFIYVVKLWNKLNIFTETQESNMKISSSPKSTEIENDGIDTTEAKNSSNDSGSDAESDQTEAWEAFFQLDDEKNKKSA